MPENVPFDELEVKDRSFSLGEQVVKIEDPTGAIGYIAEEVLCYDLRFPDGRERREVPAGELWPVNPYIPGSYVSHNGCLGSILRAHANLVVELSDRSICVVGPLTVGVREGEDEGEDPEWITTLNAAGEPDESNYVSNEQYYPSLSVLLDSSYLRNEARFLRGGFKRNVERGRILRVCPTKIDVEWVNKRPDRAAMPQPTIAASLNPTLVVWNFRSSWQYKDHVLSASLPASPQHQSLTVEEAERNVYREGRGFYTMPQNVWRMYMQTPAAGRDDGPSTAEIIGIHTKYLVKWADSRLTLEESRDIVEPLEYRMEEVMPDDTVYREGDDGRTVIGIVTAYDPVEKLADVNWHKVISKAHRDDEDKEVSDEEEEEEEEEEDHQEEIFPFERVEKNVPLFSIYRPDDDDPSGIHVGSIVRRIPVNPRRPTKEEKAAWFGEVLGIRNGLANVLWENGVRENVNPFSMIELYDLNEEEEEEEGDEEEEEEEEEEEDEDNGEGYEDYEDEVDHADDNDDNNNDAANAGAAGGGDDDDEEDVCVNKLSKLSDVLYSELYKTNSGSLSQSTQNAEEFKDNKTPEEHNKHEDNDSDTTDSDSDSDDDDDDDEEEEEEDKYEPFQVIDDDIPTTSPLFNNHKEMITESSDAAKRIVREWKTLKAGKLDGVWVRAYSQNAQFMSFMIAGPEDTPYENGLFLFDVYFPMLYPAVPPEVFFRAVTPRLHPNLYEDGKVCLSLLGTWTSLSANEGWQPGVSGILQVILSIQGLILGTAEPFYNEAWYESVKESQYKGTSESKLYNETAAMRTLGVMLHYAEVIAKNENEHNKKDKMPSELFPFEDTAKKFLVEKREAILKQCTMWMGPSPPPSLPQPKDDTAKNKKTCSVFVSWHKGFSAAVKELYPRLEKNLSLLK